MVSYPFRDIQSCPRIEPKQDNHRSRAHYKKPKLQSGLVVPDSKLIPVSFKDTLYAKDICYYEPEDLSLFPTDVVDFPV